MVGYKYFEFQRALEDLNKLTVTTLLAPLRVEKPEGSPYFRLQFSNKDFQRLLSYSD